MSKGKKTEPGYWSIITSEVRYNENLSANEKLLYTEITCLQNKLGYCFATNAYFANIYNVAKRTIQRWLNNLEKEGLIRIEITTAKNSKQTKRKIWTLQNIGGRVTRVSSGGG